MKTPKRLNHFLALTGAGLQMGIIIFAGANLGKYLDSYFGLAKKWFTIGLTLFSIVISFYFLMKQLKRLNDSDHE